MQNSAITANSKKGKMRSCKYHKHGKHSGDNGKDKKCFNCQRPGYWARDCWYPGGGKEGQGPHQKGKGKSKASPPDAAVIVQTNDDKEEFAFCTLDFTSAAVVTKTPKEH